MADVQPYKRILIIRNPASTNAKKLGSRVKVLQNLFPSAEFTVIETSPRGRAANRELLLKYRQDFGPKTLLCIAAGDGTVNLVIETLILDKSLDDNMRKTVILPLWGGNANDLAHMLNGYASSSKLKRIISNNNVVEVHPLKVSLTINGKFTDRIAACYASFGATAFAAHRINTPRHRKHYLTQRKGLRLIPEIYTVIKAFLEVPTFKLTENGVKKVFYEYALINGSRIAKLERLPLRLTDNSFYVARITRKHPVAALYILQILRKRKPGRITSNERRFSLADPTWLQLDGEVVALKANTDVTIQLSKRPFYALSIRLSPPS